VKAGGLTREQLVDELGLSEEQREAIGLAEDTVIAAGAGAGKTTTLVGAVAFDLLVAGVPAERICVCTFTRAAAANLYSRLDGVLERFAGAQAPDLSRLWIGTIDSLLARLLRENALGAGISPGFQVADDRDLVLLHQEAARAALEQLTERELAEIDRVLDAASQDKLAQALKDAFERARTLELGLPRSWIPEVVDETAVIETLLALAAEAGGKAAEKIEQDVALIEAGQLEGLSEPRTQWGVRRNERNSDLLDAAIEARERWRQARADIELAPAREALERALALYASEYAERKREAGLLDFGDLDEEAEKLVDGRELAHGFLRTYIDETQDTNPRQYRILRKLSSGPLISIGDINQSIYSFRGADVAVFRREAEVARRHVTLSDNYRSRPEVLEAVNGLCERMPALAEGLIRMRSAGPKAKLEPLGEPAVEVLCFALEQRNNKMPGAAAEAAVAVPEIIAAARRRGIPLSDVCVLVRDNREVGAYTEAFRRIGVPAVGIQNKGLFEQSETLDVLAYLRLLADPDDEKALLRVLTSPFCGLSDVVLFEALEGRAAQLRQLRADLGRPPKPSDPGYPRLVDHLASTQPEFWSVHQEILARRGRGSPAALLRRAIEAHGFDLALEALDETGARWRNVEKLLALIGELERRSVGVSARALAERLEIERAANQEGQDDRLPAELEAVRVMTVHQAKGDEFKLVAVARLSRQRPSHSRSLVVDDSGRIGLRRGDIKDSAHCRHGEAEQRRADEEEWRVLYVALTRAEEHLILVGAGRLAANGEPDWTEPFTRLIDPQEIPAEPGMSRVIERGRGRISVRRLATRPSEVRGAESFPASEESLEDELPVADPELPALASGALSYTTLSAWRRCSMRRRIERELGLRRLEPLEEGAREPGQQGGARGFGSEIHKAIARLGFEDGESHEAALASTALHGAERERAAGMLQSLLDSPLARELRRAGRIRRELPFSLTLGEHLLQGRIDLLAEFEGEALVVDWKSGEDPDDVFGADYALQRRLYALAVLSSSEPPERVRSLSYPLAGGEPVFETFTLKDLGGLRAELIAEIERILAEAPVAAAGGEPEPFCLDCPGLERICPMSGLVDLRAGEPVPAGAA